MSKRLALVGAIAAVATATAAALATTPGTNGQIIFRRYLDAEQNRSAIFMVNADGGGVRQITRPPRRTNDEPADWAPDGRRIAFTRNPAVGPHWINVVNADGTGLLRVTPVCRQRITFKRVPRGCQDATEPSFTPDNQHVTYVRASGRLRIFRRFEREQIEHSAVAIIRVDGRGERVIRRLPRYTGDIHWPQVSPDGRLIVFERANSPVGTPRSARAVFVMNTDGTDLHRVTPWRLNAGDGADWAPDGSRLLFRSNVEVADERSQFYTVRPDGTGLTQLTHFPFTGRRLFSATFSPDGRQIVFGKGDRRGLGDLWTMSADGTNAHPILEARPWDSGADWGAVPR